jgi:hypothetical protein
MTPEYFLRCFLGAWLAAVVALIAYRILTGQISLQGLFTMDGDRFSPERLQLALVTFGLLGIFVGEAFSTWKMPAVPSELIALLAGSQVLYLGGKIAGR